MNNVKKTVLLGLFVSQALILSLIESWISIPTPVPGVKLGLANIITVIAIIFFGFREAVSVVIVRCVLSSIFGGGGWMLFLFSVTGGVLSAVVMSVLFKSGNNKFSITGISIAGAISHNIGQILIAALLMKDLAVAVVLPVLLISGCIMGFFVGLVSSFLENALRKTKIFE
ncbi:Gx transporter family protein [Acetivibrio straminisolvens]|uniref:Heptaprenyl diphosphate synthase component I n=1 Tax=Acetivibrio straminisolvens JCM 21531 TaxID=1294263 RepID=W4V1Z6_9FIRM|nr:Gx transporter family protein [Acetivibrio straminisolvens]GAE86833.1 heptaprenyl diphosphate synthase component I [Acetivibrio straminisolvens JCM 21531]